MELIIKAAAAALTAGLVGLLIKRSNPELSLALSACTVALILIGALGFAKGILELSEAVKTIAGGSAKFISPVLKCVAGHSHKACFGALPRGFPERGRLGCGTGRNALRVQRGPAADNEYAEDDRWYGLKKLFLILLFCPLFFTPCSAEALYDQAADMSGVYEIQRALPEEEREISGELRVGMGVTIRAAP